MKTNTTTILHYATYLAMLEGSVGSRMYRTLWAKVNGQTADITKDGLIACAFFASSVLVHFKLIKSPHATVQGTLNDMETSGWYKIEGTPWAGCIVVWEKAGEADGEEHLHMGFYLNELHALSHSDKERTPVAHDLNFNGRTIIAMYSHQFLEPQE